MLAGDLDHAGKIVIALRTGTHIAGIDPVLGQGLGAVRVLSQQAVPVVMKITTQGDGDAHPIELFAHCRDRLCCRWRVDRQADDLAPSRRQRLHLNRGPDDVGRIGIRHGLHDHRGAAADLDRPVSPTYQGHAGGMPGQRPRNFVLAYTHDAINEGFAPEPIQ